MSIILNPQNNCERQTTGEKGYPAPQCLEEQAPDWPRDLVRIL